MLVVVVSKKMTAPIGKVSEADRNLELGDRSKDEFIAMVGHELKTPLTPMKIYLDMFCESQSLDDMNEDQDKAVSVIAKNLDNLEGLIGDILDVYKLDMGKMKFDMHDVAAKIPDRRSGRIAQDVYACQWDQLYS